MNFLAARLHHGFAPNSSREAAEAVTGVLSLPCFNLLTRLSATRHGRQLAYAPQDSGGTLTYLMRNENDAVVLDNGRLGNLQAMARIQTGRTLTLSALGRPAQLLSYIILPVTSQADDMIAATCDLAVALHVVSGAVTVEPSFEAAQAFVLTTILNGNGRMTAAEHLRARERSTLYYFLSEVDTRIPAPEWGLFLSTGHLNALPTPALRSTSVFAGLRELVGGRLAFLQMTADPLDVMGRDFDDRLHLAREFLAPILMDASQVPEKRRVEPRPGASPTAPG